MRYLMDNGGKRIRAMLLLLCTSMYSKNYKKAMPAAAAIELLHAFSLIHDDIMDNDDLRRGQLTIHRKWDTSVAILSGDALAALAYRTLRELPPSLQDRILDLFTETFVGLCEGQALDKEFENQREVKESEYLTMIGQKTALLFSTSARIGAIIGGASAAHVKSLGLFGYNLGMAFQIQDDLLDVTGDERMLGKEVGSDLIEGKKSYVSILAAKDNRGRGMLDTFRTMKNTAVRRETLESFRKYLRVSGIQVKAETKTEAYLSAAEKQLAAFKNTPAKASLLEIAGIVRERQS